MATKGKDTKSKKPKKPATWQDISDQVYTRIEIYATRFILIALVGVVIGVIGLVYGSLNILVLGAALQDVGVFLSVFIGIGALVVSAILLLWGLFWRGKVESKTII